MTRALPHRDSQHSLPTPCPGACSTQALPAMLRYPSHWGRRGAVTLLLSLQHQGGRTQELPLSLQQGQSVHKLPRKTAAATSTGPSPPQNHTCPSNLSPGPGQVFNLLA